MRDMALRYMSGSKSTEQHTNILSLSYIIFICLSKALSFRVIFLYIKITLNLLKIYIKNPFIHYTLGINFNFITKSSFMLKLPGTLDRSGHVHRGRSRFHCGKVTASGAVYYR